MLPPGHHNGVWSLPLFITLLIGHLTSRTQAVELQAVPLRYLSYDAIVKRMHDLAAMAPDILQLWNAQDRYQVASPGSCRAADANGLLTGETPCKHWFLTVTNQANASNCVSKPFNSYCMHERAQVFLSGNLHGDEVVGPLTLLSFVEDLVYTYQQGDNAWVNRMLNTRYLVVIPITNPLGFDKGVREENGHDPNRDFPYAQHPSQCMLTTAARAVNEVWREHIFWAGITFHGGMQAIAYEWGSANHLGHNSESPDDAAQHDIGFIMRDAAGAFKEQAYPVDRMNRLVYPVPGGMEDWAYAGSWDTNAVKECTPSTYGGYPAEKTQYTPAMLRAFNILVETADDKQPAQADLGSHPPFAEAPPGQEIRFSLADVYQVQGSGDGHIPRNIRLTAAIVDLVQPYVHVMKTNVQLLIDEQEQTKRARRRLRKHESAGTLDVRGSGQLIDVAFRQLSLAGTKAGRRVSADEYQGPSICIPSAQQSCDSWKDQYASWQSVVVNGDRAAQGSLDVPAKSLFVSTEVKWDIGGASHVDATSMLVGTWDARVPPQMLEYTGNNLSDRLVGYGLSIAEAQSFAAYVTTWRDIASGKTPISSMPNEVLLRHAAPVSGATQWQTGGNTATFRNVMVTPFTARYSDCFRVPLPSTRSLGVSAECSQGTENITAEDTRYLNAVAAYIILPYAAVDASWTQQQSPDPNGVSPQSHIVNARSNPDWFFENNNFILQGRRHVVSDPVFVAVQTTLATSEAPAEPILCEIASTDSRVVVLAGNPSTVGVAGVQVSHTTLAYYASVVSGMLLSGIAIIAFLAFRNARRASGHALIPDMDVPSAASNIQAPEVAVGK